MKLVGYEADGEIWVGALEGGSISPIAGREAFWRDPHSQMARSRSGATLRLADVVQRPAVPAGARVICIGLNYRNHALEGGGEIPTVPVIFGRWTASLVCDGDECPQIEQRYDWEGELAAVIGQPMFRVGAEAGLAGVFGYCAFNDLSARTFQRATPQWTFGKNAERSGPMSPIATADEVGDPAAGLHLVTRVNGAVMQDDTTADLIFPVGVLVEYISQLMTLNPGDLIVTGTPAGIGAARRPPIFLKPGDVVEVEIEKVGKVSNRIVAAAAPTQVGGAA
jgi:2-keto-4-pentenoate hydratase/2-oxohepta-3-ene-1,7-dioic acid hydratase in catechol pathway